MWSDGQPGSIEKSDQFSMWPKILTGDQTILIPKQRVTEVRDSVDPFFIRGGGNIKGAASFIFISGGNIKARTLEVPRRCV